MSVPSQWTDGRLDDLQRRVSRVEPIVEIVARLEERLESNTRELRANTTATKEVADQLEKAQVEPLNRSRRFWGAIVIAVAGAVTAGLMVVLGTVIAGAH